MSNDVAASMGQDFSNTPVDDTGVFCVLARSPGRPVQDPGWPFQALCRTPSEMATWDDG